MPPRWGLRFFGLGSTKISLLTGLGQRTAGGRTLTLPPRLHVGNTANKRTKMALTREYKKTVIARIKRDRKFARLIYVSPVTSKPASRGRIKTSHSEVLCLYYFFDAINPDHSVPDQKSVQVSESSTSGRIPSNTFSTLGGTLRPRASV